MKRRILVTGGSGFVGNRLARRLLADGHDVHLLLRPGHDDRRLRDMVEVRRHLVDLGDARGVRGVVAEVRPSWIFHLAVYGAYSWQTDADEMVRTNVLGTGHLVQAALAVGFDAFVNTGSSSEYGFQAGPPNESTPPVPNSYYALTKSAATQYCTFAARHHDVHLPTLRLYSVYGPGETRQRLMPSIVAAGLANRWPPLAAPDIARDFVYVTDAIRAYLLAAEATSLSRGTIFNVGSGVQTTLGDVVAIAARVFSITSTPPWGTLAPRIWDTTSWIADPRRILAKVGWRPEVDVESGLRQMAAAWPWD